MGVISLLAIFYVLSSLAILYIGIENSKTFALYLSFKKIADYNTLVPEGSGTFSFLGSEPVTNGFQVFFRGFDAAQNDGLYLADSNNSISLVVNPSTPVPDLENSSFSGFDNDIHIGGDTLAFEAILDSNLDKEIIITARGNPLILTNNVDTVNKLNPRNLDPSNQGIFMRVNEPAVDSKTGAIAFNNEQEDAIDGVYTNFTGSITTVVDKNTSVPGLEDFSFKSFSDQISFEGNIGIDADLENLNSSTSAQVLLLATPSGLLTIAADTVNTLNPSTKNKTFTTMGPIDVEGRNFAFFGRTNRNQGIYASFGNSLQIIADNQTLVPTKDEHEDIKLSYFLRTLIPGKDEDEEIKFSYFRTQFSLDGSNILFEGFYNGGRGIYLWHRGKLFCILDVNHTLEGLTIKSLNLSFSDAIKNNQLVFNVSFFDDSRAIYKANFFISVPKIHYLY